MVKGPKPVKLKTKARRVVNVVLGIILFVFLIGYAFKISWLFGASFVVAFALEIYDGDLKRKPWRPIAIFVGALIIRIALGQFLDPVLTSKTAMDLGVSALVFIAILVFGWKIKKG